MKFGDSVAKADLNTMPVTIAIVEDNQEISTMLARAIAREPNLQCLNSCASGEEALDVLPKNPPQVAIMDLRLPGMSGIECTARLRQLLPETQVLVYTAYGDDDLVFNALKAGASGYLLKRSTRAEILEAIFDVYQGGAPMSGEIARKIVRLFSEPPPPRETERLTPRQEEILGLLARGFTAKEIADQLGVGFDSVRIQLKDIFVKLHVRTKTEAASRPAN
jgi:DNA-binding NarL/FixJ family response regulator